MITIICLLIPYVNTQGIQVFRIEFKTFSLNNFQIQLNSIIDSKYKNFITKKLLKLKIKSCQKF